MKFIFSYKKMRFFFVSLVGACWCFLLNIELNYFYDFFSFLFCFVLLKLKMW